MDRREPYPKLTVPDAKRRMTIAVVVMLLLVTGVGFIAGWVFGFWGLLVSMPFGWFAGGRTVRWADPFGKRRGLGVWRDGQSYC